MYGVERYVGRMRGEMSDGWMDGWMDWVGSEKGSYDEDQRLDDLTRFLPRRTWVSNIEWMYNKKRFFDMKLEAIRMIVVI